MEGRGMGEMRGKEEGGRVSERRKEGRREKEGERERKKKTTVNITTNEISKLMFELCKRTIEGSYSIWCSRNRNTI